MQRYGNEHVRVAVVGFDVGTALLTYGSHWQLFAKAHPHWLDAIEPTQQLALRDKVIPGIVCGISSLSINAAASLQTRTYLALANERYMQSAAAVDFAACTVVVGIRKTWLPVLEALLPEAELARLTKMIRARFGKLEDPILMQRQAELFQQFWKDLYAPSAAEQPLRTTLVYYRQLPQNLFTIPPDPTALRRQQQAMVSALSSTRRTTPEKLMRVLGLTYA